MNLLEMIKNEKVEWRKLGEIGVFFGGLTGKTKSDFGIGNSKYVPYKNIFSNIEVDLNNLEAVVIANEKQNKLELGDILFTGSSENLEECGLSSVITKEVSDLYLNSFCFAFRFNRDIEVLPSFSKYLFRDIRVRKKIIKTASGVTRFNISKEAMKKIQIPIPSLETQEKIVKVLDKFTKYVTELQARTRHYEYYRDMLLSESYLNKKNIKSIDKLKLEILFDIKNGYTPSKSIKSYWENGTIPWIRLDDIREKGNVLESSNLKITKEAVKGKIFEKNSIILSTSATVGIYALVKMEFVANQRFTVFSLKDIYKNKINIDYIYHYFYLISKWCANNLKLGNFNSVDIEKLKKYEINIPTIEIQERIVYFLDNFEKVCKDLNIGLPKEIELREKQYEYFREKLLTFETERVYTPSEAIAKL